MENSGLLGTQVALLHAWAALKYIPNRVAGVAMYAPLVNPYESGMTKDEISSFFSGKLGQIDKWLSVSLGKKVASNDLVGKSSFEELWHWDVEESIRQGSTKPFVEEAMLQGMDDVVTPPTMADYVASILPSAVVHKLPEEGHFSYFFLCDECHRQIISTLFGEPQDPLETVKERSDLS
ncbi:Hypothetical predicted protein [Olea europaea subsp. europaea]|uniref:Uncharacterized protein n=1 Tax=Olea europaea subsp. europaea TaxID=158383 RepID=A0A8S0T704_OLEEU|nr:Hypothetical predicted protein [Olea europaea subsp. europaea]